MILSDRSIRSAQVTLGPPLIVPWNDEHLNPTSVDLTLSPIVRIPRFDRAPLDVAEIPEDYTRRIDIREESIFTREVVVSDGVVTLSPGGFLLAATNEVVSLPRDLVGRVEGKSSLGRLGLAIHITAGFIDPGFQGSITLEVANLSPRPIVLRQDMRIAQIAFTATDGPVRRSYQQTGHYQGQPAGEPVESRYRL